jgi:HPt (histidine-containing phosphotransfer) domain-containing protein
VIEDLQATFLHRFTTLARTRITNARNVITSGDLSSIGGVVRDLHSIAGEGGLLGLEEVVPLARRAEDGARHMVSAPSTESTGAFSAILLELEQLVDRLAGHRA